MLFYYTQETQETQCYYKKNAQEKKLTTVFFTIYRIIFINQD